MCPRPPHEERRESCRVPRLLLHPVCLVKAPQGDEPHPTSCHQNPLAGGRSFFQGTSLACPVRHAARVPPVSSAETLSPTPVWGQWLGGSATASIRAFPGNTPVGYTVDPSDTRHLSRPRCGGWVVCLAPQSLEPPEPCPSQASHPPLRSGVQLASRPEITLFLCRPSPPSPPSIRHLVCRDPLHVEASPA